MLQRQKQRFRFKLNSDLTYQIKIVEVKACELSSSMLLPQPSLSVQNKLELNLSKQDISIAG